MSRIKIKEIEFGKNISVEVDGQEISNIVALDLRIRVDEIPTVVIRKAIVGQDMNKVNLDIQGVVETTEEDTKINDILDAPVEETEIMN